MKQLNKRFDARGNVMLDELLFMLENSVVLGEPIKLRIENCILDILSNFRNGNKNMAVDLNRNEEVIYEIITDLNRLSIFNPNFIDLIRFKLKQGLIIAHQNVIQDIIHSK